MNPLYIALPLFVIFVWVIAFLAVRHDRNVLEQQKLRRGRR